MNIPTEEGRDAMWKALDTRVDKTVSTNTFTALLEHVLKLNIFEFHSEFFILYYGAMLCERVTVTDGDHRLSLQFMNKSLHNS